MRYAKLLVLLAVVALLAITIGLTASQAAPPAAPPPAVSRFDLSWWVMNGGGGKMTSTHFLVYASIGQPAITNELTSAHYRLISGFWGGTWPWLRTFMPTIWR